MPLLEQGKIAAMAHITGGGLVDNLPRVLGSSDAVLDRTSWPVPALFRYLCEAGNVDAEERYQVLNMGIGMALIVDAADVAAVGNHFRAVGEPFFTIGRIEAGSGIVRWSR